MPEVTVVLVEPQIPANIGMTCRALANFGVDNLRLVNPCDHHDEMARRLAVGASPLLDSAEIYDSLEAALADQHVAAATTRRKGRYRGELLEAPALAERVRSMPSGTRLALVFGREDSGLTLAEVEKCHLAVTIKTSSHLGSLNLAQAVLVVLYELSRAEPASKPERNLPTHADHQALCTAVEALMMKIGFLNPQRPDAIMQPLRRMLNRIDPDSDELNLLRGMFEQLDDSASEWPAKRRGAPQKKPSSKRHKLPD